MKVIYSKDAIQKLVGPQYQVKATQRGGFQVNLVLKDDSGTVLTDMQKVQRNLAVFEKLKAAGYAVKDEDFRISAPPRDRSSTQWTPWCSVFVNEPVQASASSGDGGYAAGQLDLLRQLAKQGVDVNKLLAGEPTPAAETPEATPTGADGAADEETPPV